MCVSLLLSLSLSLLLSLLLLFRMSLTVKQANGSSVTVEIDNFDMTLLSLKEKIATVTSIDVDSQRVVYRGKILRDDTATLNFLGIQQGDAIHVVASKGPPGGVPSPPNTTTQTPPEAQRSNDTNVTESTNPYGNLFNAGSSSHGMNLPSSTGTGTGTGGGLNMASVFGSGMPQGAPSPEQFEAIMQLMQSNPQLMQELLASHPETAHLSAEEVNAMMVLSRGMMTRQQQQQEPSSMASAFTPPPSSSEAGAAVNNMSVEEERILFKSQLDSLREMGFPNEEANLQALRISGGNVDLAIARLLGE